MAKRWTDEETQYLIQNYPNRPIQEIQEHLQFKRHRIHDKASLLGLKKEVFFVKHSQESIEKRFQKGMKAWNKGMKLGSDWGGKETRFKKGQEPHNKLPEEIKEISLLRQRLMKNVKERIKRKKI